MSTSDTTMSNRSTKRNVSKAMTSKNSAPSPHSEHVLRSAMKRKSEVSKAVTSKKPKPATGSTSQRVLRLASKRNSVVFKAVTSKKQKPAPASTSHRVLRSASERKSERDLPEVKSASRNSPKCVADSACVRDSNTEDNSSTSVTSNVFPAPSRAYAGGSSNTRGSYPMMSRCVYAEKCHARICIGGERGDASSQFNTPHGVAVSPDEARLYVTDTFNNRVKIYDERGTLIKTFGLYGNGEGQFNQPVGIVVNSHGEVIIADHFNNRIVVCSQDGVFMSLIGNGQVRHPVGVAVDNLDNVYVCSHGNSSIQVFNRNGEFIHQFNQEECVDWGELCYIAVSPRTGYLYVIYYHSHRVQVFSAHGKFIFTFGTYGKENGQMSNPTGIAIDEQGFVFLSDCYNHRIQVFHEDGTFISTFGTYGIENGQFRHPRDLVVTKHGDVIVADCANHRIQIF